MTSKNLATSVEIQANPLDQLSLTVHGESAKAR